MKLVGSSRLLERPLSVYEDLCRQRGFLFRREDGTLTVEGKLTPGAYRVRGDISSQFITGLLFALSLLPEESTLTVTGNLESASYLDMTLDAMRSFGKEVKREGNVFTVGGRSSYECRSYAVEGDWSNAAFLEGLNLLGGNVCLSGLREDSLSERVFFGRW